LGTSAKEDLGRNRRCQPTAPPPPPLPPLPCSECGWASLAVSLLFTCLRAWWFLSHSASARLLLRPSSNSCTRYCRICLPMRLNRPVSICLHARARTYACKHAHTQTNIRIHTHAHTHMHPRTHPQTSIYAPPRRGGGGGGGGRGPPPPPPPPPPHPRSAQRENLGVSRLKMRNFMRKLTHSE
jgi:hypothetical protein